MVIFIGKTPAEVVGNALAQGIPASARPRLLERVAGLWRLHFA